MNHVVFGSQWVGQGMRGAEHRVLDCQAGQAGADLHGRASFQVCRVVKYAGKVGREQSPGLATVGQRDLRSPGGHERFQGVGERIDSG